ncbi:hypothetical protein [Nocardiopsis deserti]|uniref:hypothetical protein n=1 Tax=Nocardiopsis deserti TaxID=2605988 RepID=UPI00123C17E4|nr:hypothetical protein [Nocardiopsis deserti]
MPDRVRVVGAGEDNGDGVSLSGFSLSDGEAEEVGRMGVDGEDAQGEDYEVAVLEGAIVVSGDVGSGEGSWATVREWGGDVEEIKADVDSSGHRVNDVISVPGAVVVSHGDGEGESGLVGLH